MDAKRKYYGVAMMQRIVLFFVCFMALSVQGQNPHFSQAFNLPQWANPAFTTGIHNLGRLTLASRTQWGTVSVPFNTHLFAAEAKIGHSKELLNIGIVGINDVAGDGNYTQNVGQAQIGKSFFLNRKKSIALFLGISAATYQVAYDLSKLRFNSQYQNGFQAQLPHGENAVDQSTQWLSIGAGNGIVFFHQEITFLLGFSMNHINTPRVTFYEANNYLASLSEFQAGLKFSGKKSVIELNTQYAKQSTHEKLMWQAIVRWPTFHPQYYPILSLGGRAKDAWIPAVGAGGRAWQFMYSFDVNNSDLRASSRSYGAHEISLIYIFKPAEKIKELKYCPSFI